MEYLMSWYIGLKKSTQSACWPVHNQNAHCYRLQGLLLTFDLHIHHLWVDTEGQVAGQCPGCGGPGNERHLLILYQWEVNDDGWILNVLEDGNRGHVAEAVAICTSPQLRRLAPTL